MLFLEFDSERSGDFAPLRHVPAGTTVVLGLVSSKTPVLESRDDLLRRIDEASKVVPVERLGAVAAMWVRVDDRRQPSSPKTTRSASSRWIVEVCEEVWGTA